MRKFLYALLFTGAVVALSGCGTTITVVEHRLVMPDDNMLVDCDIEAPPPRAQYLATAPSKDATELEKIKAALKTAEERERLLTDLNLKQYANANVCNKRWKGVRDFKAKAQKELGKTEPKG